MNPWDTYTRQNKWAGKQSCFASVNFINELWPTVALESNSRAMGLWFKHWPRETGWLAIHLRRVVPCSLFAQAVTLDTSTSIQHQYLCTFPHRIRPLCRFQATLVSGVLYLVSVAKHIAKATTTAAATST